MLAIKFNLKQKRIAMNNDEIIKFIKEVFQQEFPCASVNGRFQSNGITISGNLNNSFFFGTKFYAQSSHKKYLHFTKAESAIKILQSSSLRLSNLNTFNDKLEFILAAKNIFQLSENEIQEYKDKTFAVCFTELLIGQNVSAEFPYHWKRYADEEKGVAFEFEFKQYKKEGYECFEDPALPPFYYLMRVQYYNDITQDQIINRITSEVNNLENKTSLIEFISPFLSAYKREKFREEEEIRLFFSDGLDSHDFHSYDNSDKEETFCGLAYEEFNPFRQLPFTCGSSSSTDTFLNLNGIYLGRNIDNEYKLQLTQISDKEGIQLHSG